LVVCGILSDRHTDVGGRRGFADVPGPSVDIASAKEAELMLEVSKRLLDCATSMGLHS
jgi:hypothetical protein